MKTLNLNEAAAFLHVHPITLQKKAKAGLIPGTRIGRRWVFIDVDLLQYIRSQYTSRALQGQQMEESKCHSLNAKTVLTTGLASMSRDDEYSKALGLPTGKKRRNIKNIGSISSIPQTSWNVQFPDFPWTHATQSNIYPVNGLSIS